MIPYSNSPFFNWKIGIYVSKRDIPSSKSANFNSKIENVHSKRETFDVAIVNFDSKKVNSIFLSYNFLCMLAMCKKMVYQFFIFYRL